MIQFLVRKYFSWHLIHKRNKKFFFNPIKNKKYSYSYEYQQYSNPGDDDISSKNDEDKSEQKKTLKYKDGSIDLDYYNNYNLTEDLEKSFNQSGYHNEETNENLYKDVEYIDEKKEKKKK